MCFFMPVGTSSGETQAQASGGNLLSVLLDKGTKLREQMIVSTLDSKGVKPPVYDKPVTHDPPYGMSQRRPVDNSQR